MRGMLRAGARASIPVSVAIGRNRRPARLALLAALIVLPMATAACGDDARERTVADGTVETPALMSPDSLRVALTRDGPLARRVAEYRLTPERVSRWSDAENRLDVATRGDTVLLRAADHRALADRRSDPVDYAIARLEASAPARRAIEDAGLSPRDFVFTTLAMYQAQLASEAGAPASVRALAADNVQFFEERRADVGPVDRRRVRYVVDDRDDDSDRDSERRKADTDSDSERDSERKRRERRGERDRDGGRP